MKYTINRSEGANVTNYYLNNRKRMRYKEYQIKLYPIGGRMGEKACKFVIGKRIKGSGMSWNKADKEKILKFRVRKLNELLHGYFVLDFQIWALAA